MSAFEDAVSAYKAGNLVLAEQLCQKIIAAEHESFDALYLLAAVQSRLGKNEIALTNYDRALKARPSSAAALSDLGQTLYNLKRYDGAVATYDRALNIRPDFALTHFRRANALLELERYTEALASYDRAIALRPNLAAAHSNRGNVLQKLRRFAEALASHDRALSVRPAYVEAYYNRGNVLQDLKRFGDAVASYDRALDLQPNFVEALSNRGNALQQLKRYEDALASYDRALALRSTFAEAWSNRGAALQELRRYEEALASCDRAVGIQPHHSGALANRGIVLRQLRRFDEALTSFERAIVASPNNADAHFGEAEVRLLLGDFERGWEKYEWRSRGQQLRDNWRNFTQPGWREHDQIAGKTVLLHAEQGFGDTIQFCRYAPLVAQRGARVVLGVQDSLKDLMTGVAGTAQVISTDPVLPNFDLHCPLLSLPGILQTRLETIPATTPYLQAPPQAVVNWDLRLGPKRRPRIGLAWSGRPTHKNDYNRSIGLEVLLPLLNLNATFVSVHKDVRSEDASMLRERSEIVHFGDDLRNFADTAALISNLDLVISVDTSVAHLAGALAKPVWILLPFVPDWRWLLDRDDSPWYPTARLFRQDGRREWDSVVARVHSALSAYLVGRC